MNSTQILDTLRSVVDPEIGLNIVDLGLIYNLEVQDNCIYVAMTMTAPTCPLGEMILSDADRLLRTTYPQARDVQIEMVWNPPWSPERMTTEARDLLGWKD